MRRSGDQQHSDTASALAKTEAAIATSKAQAEIMRGQLRVMENDQRPWVSVGYPTPVSDFQYINTGATLTVKFSMHNYGHSPALNVEIGGRMPLTKNHMGIVKQQDAICNELLARPVGNEGNGFTIFPNEPLPIEFRFSVERSEIDKVLKENALPDPVILPIIIGCIRYVFAADSSQHVTSFIYDVAHRPPWGIIRTDQGNIPMEQILLITPNFGSGRTN
jgi:hypothetical protein